MYVRLTFCKFSQSSLQEAKRLFKEEFTPVVLSQKGIINVMLLEPTEPSDDFISLTLWKTKSDSDAYVFSSTFHQMVTKLETFLAKEPFVKTYFTEKLMIPV